MSEPRHVPVEELEQEAFSSFGSVARLPARAPDANGLGWSWWGETALLEADARPYGVGYVQAQPNGSIVNWAERHMHGVEMLIPLDGDCLVYVGPPDYMNEPERLPELDRFRVFHVRRGHAVILHKAVWHGAPLALDVPVTVVVLLPHGTGASDLSLVHFADTPLLVDLQQ